MASTWTYLPFEGARLVYRDRAGHLSNHPAAIARAIAEVNEGWEGRKTREYAIWSFGRPAEPPFVLESGKQLESVTVAYETYGRLSPARDNAVLICHALTGDSHVARHPEAPGSQPGWWEHVVGPGKAIDTDRHFVVCANVLGGCNGTTGPASVDPVTGEPYRMNFPVVTPRDAVRVQERLARHLGIERLAAVVGGSLGGMQALEWAVTFPDAVERVVAIAAPGRVSAQAVAYNEVQRQAITGDPAWQGGRYSAEAAPERGLSVARMLGMITYQSEESMERKFGLSWVGDEREGLFSFRGRFQVENYLHYQGRKLARRFDPNSYLYLLKSLDLFDLGRGHGGIERALSRIQAHVHVIGITSDILYPLHQQEALHRDLLAAGVSAEFDVIDSPWGHDAFLVDFEQLAPLLSKSLGTPALGTPALGTPAHGQAQRAGHNESAHPHARVSADKRRGLPAIPSSPWLPLNFGSV